MRDEEAGERVKLARQKAAQAEDADRMEAARVRLQSPSVRQDALTVSSHFSATGAQVIRRGSRSVTAAKPVVVLDRVGPKNQRSGHQVPSDSSVGQVKPRQTGRRER